MHHLLRQYNGTAESVIRTYQPSLNNLTDKLEELRFDVNTFYNYATETLNTLCDAGGDYTQVSLKLYKALTFLKIDTFNSEIRVYNTMVFVKDKTLNFTKLTTIASAKYTPLVMCGQCPSFPRASSKK
eukprot:9594867-Ditylum_brightwellii.AAC.1